jgi:hypothetical protein
VATSALVRAADIARCEAIFRGTNTDRLTDLLDAPSRSAFLTAAKHLLDPECPVNTEARLLLTSQLNLATIPEVMGAVPGLRVQPDDVAYADMLSGYANRSVREANLKDTADFVLIWPGLVEHVIGAAVEAAVAHGGPQRVGRILTRLARSGLRHGITPNNPGIATLTLTHANLTGTLDGIPDAPTGPAFAHLGYDGTTDAFTRACIGLASRAYLDSDVPAPMVAIGFAEQVVRLSAATAEALAASGDLGRARMAFRVALQTEQGLRAAVPDRATGIVDALRNRLTDLNAQARGLEA